MKKTMRLVSILLTFCLMFAMLSVGMTASAENTSEAVFTWRDVWGGRGWNMSNVSDMQGYEVTNVNWENKSTSQFQWGVSNWDTAAFASKTAGTDGLVFALRLNDCRHKNGSVFGTLNMKFSIGSYSTEVQSLKVNGSTNQIVMPYSSLLNGSGEQFNPASASGNIMVEFYNWGANWDNTLESLDITVSYLYAYTGEAEKITFPVEGEGAKFAWFKWKDYWGGQNGGATSTTDIPGYNGVDMVWENKATNSFSWGMGDWGWSKEEAASLLADCEGFAFSVRLDKCIRTISGNPENFSQLDVTIKLPTSNGLYIAATAGSIPVDGQVHRILMPFSSFAHKDTGAKDLDISTIGGGDLQIEFSKYAWEWEGRLTSLKAAVSWLYGYTGDPGEIELPLAAKNVTFDCGVGDVEIDAEGNVTMPAATVDGKQFIGWKDSEGNLHKVGAKVAAAEGATFTGVAAAVELQTGAGIRWAKTEQERGIRFETYVSKDALDAIGSSSFELGALIMPYANYNADITVDTASTYGAVNVVDPKVYGEVGDNYRYYTGVVDFERYFSVSGAVLADLKLTAVSYVKVTYADGTSAYFYDMPDATNNVRTVAEVARAAMADTEFGYTNDQLAILDLYAEQSAETTVPEYRKDDADKIQ